MMAVADTRFGPGELVAAMRRAGGKVARHKKNKIKARGVIELEPTLLRASITAAAAYTT